MSDHYRIEFGEAFSLSGTHAAATIYEGCRPAAKGGLTKGTKAATLVADTQTALLANLSGLAEQEGDGLAGVVAAIQRARVAS